MDPKRLFEAKPLRAALKARRSAMAADDRASGPRLSPAMLGFTRLAAGAVVSGFLSIGDELDTAPLLAALHAAGMPVLACRSCGAKTSRWPFRAWAPGDALETVMWGIREPTADKPAARSHSSCWCRSWLSTAGLAARLWRRLL